MVQIFFVAAHTLHLINTFFFHSFSHAFYLFISHLNIYSGLELIVWLVMAMMLS
jgi:hypothetical protein